MWRGIALQRRVPLMKLEQWERHVVTCLLARLHQIAEHDAADVLGSHSRWPLSALDGVVTVGGGGGA